MAVYFITGKLGSGKTLCAVGRIRDKLLSGCKVATNLDLNVVKLLPQGHSKGELWRLPDHPNISDFESIGRGTEELDERRHGLIVLDEVGAWFNARTWADKERQKVIDWLLHSRKLGWDVFFIVQSIQMADKQARDGLAEFVVICRRTDRFKFPLIGLKLPRVHVAFVKYGSQEGSVVVDRWWYRGRDLYDAYDTRQRFKPRDWPGGLTAPVRISLPGELAVQQRRPTWRDRWPAHVLRLPPDERWELARRLAL